MASLARRVAVGMIGGTACFVGLAAVITWLGYQPLIWHRVDQELRDDARGMAPFVVRQAVHQHENGLVEFSARRGDPGLMYALVRLEDGALIGERRLGEPPPWSTLVDVERAGTTVLVEGRSWRVAQQTLAVAALREFFEQRPWGRRPQGERSANEAPPEERPPEEPQGERGDRRSWGDRGAWHDMGEQLFAGEPDHMLILLRDVEHLTAEEQRVFWGLLGLVGAATLLAGLGAWLVTRMVLRPLRAMAGAIGELDGSGHRLLPGPMPSELQVVPQRLNSLLDRIDEIRERERQFHAAAAHELRTPLAGLLAQLEVALMRERSAEEYRQSLTTCQQVSQQLQGLVEDLLQLARIDAGTVRVERVAVDVRALFERACEHHAIANDRIAWSCDEHIPRAAGDPALLERVCDNLIGNLEHGDPGPVQLRLRVAGDQLIVEVENPCAERPADDPMQLLQPFVRSAADRGIGHVGLGLSLVAALCELQGASALVDWQDGRFRVELRLPSCAQHGLPLCCDEQCRGFGGGGPDVSV